MMRTFASVVFLFGAILGTALSDQIDTLERFAFGSCAYEDSPQPIWEAIIEEQPQLFIWAGDNVYLDTEDRQMMREKYAKLGAQPGFRAFQETGAPFLATWDDHDFGMNDGGAEFAAKQIAQEEFLRFWNIPEDDPRHDQEGIYAVQYYGEGDQRVQVILLDTRYFRDPLERYDSVPGQSDYIGYRPLRRPWDRTQEPKTLLGETQWEWLEGVLREPARIRFIVTSIQFVSSEHRFEKWTNLAHERQRMIDLIEETGAEGVVFLSGDRHRADLSRWDPSNLYPIYDLTSSGLNSSRPVAGGQMVKPEPNRYRIGQHVRGHHFGMVEIDWEQPDPLITLSIVRQDQSRPIQTTFPLSSLSFADREVPSRVFAADPAFFGGESGPAVDEFEVDGEMNDWIGDSVIMADAEHIYLRFNPGTLRTLRRHAEAIHIAFDLDNDDRTGMNRSFGRGYELEIVPGAEPPPENRWRGPLITVEDGGVESELLPAEIDLHIAPSYAAEWFELRFDRDGPLSDLPSISDGGEATLRIVARDKETGGLREVLTEAFTLPVASPPADLKPATLPEKPEDAVRVVALNVLWAQPQQNPEPFARVFQLLDADIILIQEWDSVRYHETEIENWFSVNVDSTAEWDAAITGSLGHAGGVAVVAPHPISAKGPMATPVEGGGWSFPGRLASAVVDTPVGSALVGSIHLKAGGAHPSPEDERRFAEAAAMNDRLIGMKAVARPDFVVVGGDFNLNGLTGVVDEISAGLDLDGSSLAMAQPPVLGETGLFYTHGRSGAKNRLDYITYSETSAEVVNAFVLDSTRLDDASLEAMGLQREDSHASDHLPVVIDLKLRPEIDTDIDFY